jgi:hypothetical protein
MAQQIRDVLNRRTDLSTFVVYLTRDRVGRTARDALNDIIRDRTLKRGSPMGWADEQDDPFDPAGQTQRVICFSETPLEHIYSQVAEIEGRRVKLAPYGVAFTKMVARRQGINPIWYVDMTPGRDWVLKEALEQLKEDAIATGRFHDQPFARLAPFLEQMGTWSELSRKEFWWEREWRCTRDLFLPQGKVIWLCPEDEIDDLERHDGLKLADHEPVIDPRWGLEQIIARLAKLDPRDITPFGS